MIKVYKDGSYLVIDDVANLLQYDIRIQDLIVRRNNDDPDSYEFFDRSINGDNPIFSDVVTNLEDFAGTPYNKVTFSSFYRSLSAESGNHSQLNLDDGTNPHGTTKADVGLGDVPNIDATDRANHTGTQTASTISDFDTEVSNNTDVIANTAKVSADGSIDTHSDVDTSTTPPSIEDVLKWDGSNWIPSRLLWRPNRIDLNNFLLDGTTILVNSGGAGYIVRFRPNNNGKIHANILLDKDFTPYNGSDLFLKLNWRLDDLGLLGDFVTINVNYAFVTDGNNSSSTSTSLPPQNIDVTNVLPNVTNTTNLGNMTGVQNAHTLLITIERKSTGAGADNFAGSLQLLSIELKSV